MIRPARAIAVIIGLGVADILNRLLQHLWHRGGKVTKGRDAPSVFEVSLEEPDFHAPNLRLLIHLEFGNWR